MKQLCSWIVLLCTLTSCEVYAQTALPTHARILVVGCAEGVPERALLDQLRIELLSAGVTRVESVELYGASDGEPDLFDVATLRVDFGLCHAAQTELILGVADRRTGKHIERTLSVAEIPLPARSRAIALSLVELLRGVWHSLIPIADPAAPAPIVTSSPRRDEVSTGPVVTDLSVATEHRERTRIEWMGMSRIYPQTDSGDLATSLLLSKAVGNRLRMRAGGTAAGGGGDGSNVHIFQGTGRFALAMCSDGNNPAIEVGTAWDVGWAELRGAGAGRTGGLIVIGSIEATLRVPAAKGIEALVSLHAGYVLLPVTLDVPLGARQHSTGLEGSVLGVGIGLAGIL